jgi:hypothetical protein
MNPKKRIEARTLYTHFESRMGIFYMCRVKAVHAQILQCLSLSNSIGDKEILAICM